MKIKKISLSAVALATILLAVGCGSNTTEQNTNTETQNGSVESTKPNETVEVVKSKYDDFIEVRAFFELAENAKNMTATEFINKVKEMDTNNTLTIEKTDNDYELISSPSMYFYRIKSNTNNVELIVKFSEFDIIDEKTMGVKSDEIDSIDLILHDENLILTNYAGYQEGSDYEITLESVNPVLTKENISQFKELTDYDEKFLNLQNKYASNKSINMEGIEEIWGRNFVNEEETFKSVVDIRSGETNADIIIVEDKRDISVNIELKDDNEIISAFCSGPGYNFSYGYKSEEYLGGSTTCKTIKGDRYFISTTVEGKDALISEIQKLYSMRK